MNILKLNVAVFSALILLLFAVVDTAAGGDYPDGDDAWWKVPSAVLTTPQDHEKHFETINADAARGVGHGGWYGIWYYDAPQKVAFSSRFHKTVQRAGMKRMVYFDTGELGEYVVYASPDGKLLYDGWSLQRYRGEAGKLHWFGLRTFMNNAPWTTLKSASHYGIRPFTYPDGSGPKAKAAGVKILLPVDTIIVDDFPETANTQISTDAKNWYDMLASRDIDGNANLNLYSNPHISDETARKTGLDTVSESQKHSNPAMAGKSGWVTVRNWFADRANPLYLDYHCQELEVLLDTRKPDAIHFDDWGGDNTLSIRKAGFGVWSIQHFHDYMAEHFSKKELAKLGIADIKRFDVVAYFKNRPWRRSKGPEPAMPYWYDKQWMSDLVFKCYQMSLIESGREHYRRLYEAVKTRKTAEGEEIAVFANAIPTFPGKPFLRGIIDVPCYEWKTFKSYGLLKKEMGYPPMGRIGWSSRLAAQFSGTGYSVPSIYVSKDKMGPAYSELHKVLQFDCLANRAVCDYGHWFLDGYSPGTAESAGFGNGFLRRIREDLGRRRYVADIGLVYCGWSQYAGNVMGGVQGGSPVREMFLKEYVGWGEFLARSNRQWDVLLSQDLDLEHLRRFKIVVLPSIASLTPAQVKTLAKYAETGGRLLVTGESGRFQGPEGRLMPHTSDVLSLLRGNPAVKIVKTKPGCAYRDKEKPEPLANLLDFERVSTSLSTDAPATVAVSLNQSSTDPDVLTVDIVNYDLDIAANAVTPTRPISITIHHPSLKQGTQPAMRWITADKGDEARWQKFPIDVSHFDPVSGTLKITVPSLTYYAIISMRGPQHKTNSNPR